MEPTHEGIFLGDGTRTDFIEFPLTVEALKEKLTIEIIAHHLSNTCRFNGATPYLYTVAQHSWNVYRAGFTDLSAITMTKANLRWLLLHDAVETFTGDIIRPIKNRLNDCVEYALKKANVLEKRRRVFMNAFEYATIEKLCMHVLVKKFKAKPFKRWKEYDNAVNFKEVDVFFRHEEPDGGYRCWHPEVAKAQFLETWERLK